MLTLLAVGCLALWIGIPLAICSFAAWFLLFAENPDLRMW